MSELFLAAAAFVGTHFLLSHPLRAPLVARLGEKGFLGLYSFVALATFAWMSWAFYSAPYGTMAWGVDEGLLILGTILMWVASILFVGSLRDNPAGPDPDGAHRDWLDRPASGVYAVTRHPMMWAFALWGLVHILIAPMPANFILSGAIILLALGGAAAQDRKKERLTGAGWTGWEGRTSYFPFGAQLAGRARWGDAVPSLAILALGTLFWLVATAAHGARHAGIWWWIF